MDPKIRWMLVSYVVFSVVALAVITYIFVL